MKIKLGIFDYKLSPAQSKVIKLLIDNPSYYVAPTGYYNHQDIRNEKDLITQFKITTKDWLRDRKILIPSNERDYLKLNPLVFVSSTQHKDKRNVVYILLLIYKTTKG